MSNKQTIYTTRALARVILEAKTPIAVGNGEMTVMSDAIVAKDANGLPYIPGSTLAGVIRHSVGDKEIVNKLMGYQDGRKGSGSRLIISEAKILDANGKPVDGLNPDVKFDGFLSNYKELPIRQHVRISHKGTAEDRGKFDNEVVYCGTRFLFEMELLMTDDRDADKAEWQKFIDVLSKTEFRLGSGTRNGYGEVEVSRIQSRILNLTKSADLKLYLEKSSQLDKDWDGWEETLKPQTDCEGWEVFKLNIEPVDFFLFGSGMGDMEGDADMTAVTARIVEWSNGKGKFSERKTLIPASSVKGALRHRVAFHYNKLEGFWATAENVKDYDVKNNVAVREIFGYEDQDVDESQGEKKIVRGRAIFSDVIKYDVEKKEKLINHVSIDRFTGGAIDGALFTEKPIYGKGNNYELTISVRKDAFVKENVREAFMRALNDICSGMLPLGGGVNRGNGIFNGTLVCS